MVSNKDQTIIKKEFLLHVKNDSCPPWSLQSEEIEHDKK